VHERAADLHMDFSLSFFESFTGHACTTVKSERYKQQRRKKTCMKRMKRACARGQPRNAVLPDKREPRKTERAKKKGKKKTLYEEVETYMCVWSAATCSAALHVAKTHRIPYLYRSFSAKVTYI